ncbi:diaminopimelate epimerase [Pimelobacter simplex]|uniref:Diaminopimelate epimerase n=1 Tax=Nocardioides simplex TaxID=2045 RepID=A0A0A1DLW0_NOCSI|nr:diaminopimelate epimerase [Pimelobacter simplex]AIY16380.1 Diaminopimelate epimerase [Pimelobacter simplex]MCG8152957.1 diaminopimelate epimerase [Pimelobacter simplex]GEB11925.1 diaminopimelate epimerase [Pimelobacter simplex]SFN03434.1 diaminopimelate epimerase [Pimelobacter simplex]
MYPFLKGHGTENDFVLLPDPDGTVHGALTPERVRALCDRRAGIGADGVLRVVRTAAIGADGAGQDAEWFMDYRNADGSVSEMCGNGVRVFGRHLAEQGLADPSAPVPVATRAGVKVLTFAGGAADGEITVDMGRPAVLGDTKVAVGERTWPALHVDMGNPHAVAFVDDLAEAGPLLDAPTHDPAVYPAGVNVEFVVRRGAGHVAMRVHERGSGETRSCGTGACAVMVATALADDAPRGTTYRVDLPGGTLRISWTADDRILMTGPAVVVAAGTTAL